MKFNIQKDKLFICKRCKNVVVTNGKEPDDEDRCLDREAPGGYWYCNYEEYYLRKNHKEEEENKK